MNEADINSQRIDSDAHSDSDTDENGDSTVSVDFSIRVEDPSIDLSLLRNVVVTICGDAGIIDGEFSVAIIGDAEMQQLHRQFLGVDETTDVISFPLESDEHKLIAEIAVCLDVARENARQLDCSAFQELLLYVVHGTLHLVGFDDTTDAEFQRMKAAEIDYMQRFGFTVIARDQSAHPEGNAS